jgi:signal transduction histidine kinase
VKYSRQGGIVTVGYRLEPGIDGPDGAPARHLFTVQDTGLGIPKAQQGRMFEKFFRADNVQSEEIDGTGLGLYIAKAITEKHGGTLAFVSEEDKGSTFTVALPLDIASGGASTGEDVPGPPAA